MPKITKLANNFTIVSEEMKETDTISINLFAQVGSKHESSEQNGISHFLEHMAFKGTEKRNSKQIAEEFDNIGGHFNACTGRESTCYYAKVLKNDFAIGADIISDIVQNSVFDKGELEKERGVVLQEIAMTNDTPDDIIFDHYQQVLYKDQSLGRSILGTEQNVTKFVQEDLLNYVDKHYYAGNLVFAVAGNIEHDRVVDFATRNFSNIKDREHQIFKKNNYVGGQYLENKDLEQVHFLMGFEGKSYLDKDIYALQILSNILGGGMSSRLFQEIRENLGLAYSISAFTSCYQECGSFSVYASTAPSDTNKLIETICNEINKAKTTITQIELTRAKAQAKASYLMGRERSSFRSEEIGRNIMCYGRHIPMEEVMAKIDAVNCEQLMQILNEIIQKDKLSIAAMGQIDKIMGYDNIKGLL